ncbi:MAG: hypothetical protein LLG20_18800 [Acidobacteriales bacterium]|nr:hypothetical protein [Terriglobales bacterium]
MPRASGPTPTMGDTALIRVRRKSDAIAATCECGALFQGCYPWDFRKSAGIHVHRDPVTGYATVRPRITFWGFPNIAEVA